MRRCLPILIIFVVLSVSSCSFINNFVVINASGNVVEVSYTLKRWTGLTPRTLPSSQLGKQIGWQELPASRYTIDQDNKRIVLQLNAGEALLVDQCRPANGQSAGDCESDEFSVQRIAIVGSVGKIALEGEQAQRAFVFDRNHSYTLTYK